MMWIDYTHIPLIWLKPERQELSPVCHCLLFVFKMPYTHTSTCLHTYRHTHTHTNTYIYRSSL